MCVSWGGGEFEEEFRVGGVCGGGAMNKHKSAKANTKPTRNQQKTRTNQYKSTKKQYSKVTNERKR